MAGAVERLLRAADRFQQAHTVLALPIAVVKKFGDDQAGKHAALLSYYGFLSLFPLLLVFATVLAYLLSNNPRLQDQLVDAAVAQFPVLGTQIAGSIKTIEGSGLGLLVGVLGTLWGGLGITQSAQDAMNSLWAIPRRSRPGYLWRLVRGLGFLVLLAGGVVGAAALAQLASSRPSPGGALVVAGSVLLNLVLLAVMFQVLSGRWVAWPRLLPGAAVGAVGWSVLQRLGVYVLDRQLAQANLVYGVFAVVIVLLSWLFLSARMLLYAAELNVVLARRLWPRSLFQPPLTEPDRRVLAALAEAEERRPEQTVEVRFSTDADD
jgi:YihY family inner membrane protein